ncbi:hypothetical protein D088_810072 [Salmonella enterica subsp. houtenae serovar 16:z4,z32:-- str. RKS3027]|nr:hypothetical protein D088_810072 [Salmonella enterica subsp. houtenae serovar 16:z4,z32:-- str. RKS3027]
MFAQINDLMGKKTRANYAWILKYENFLFYIFKICQYRNK